MKMRMFPIEKMTTPKQGMFNIYLDRYWVVVSNDNILFYGEDRSPYASPQCNANEEIARSVAVSSVSFLGDDVEYEVRHLPVVYVPINLHDYRD